MSGIQLDGVVLERLRALRLWHWKKAQGHRRAARYLCGADRMSHKLRDAENAQADAHIYHVQTLNEFFEPGDTAERDEAREDSA